MAVANKDREEDDVEELGKEFLDEASEALPGTKPSGAKDVKATEEKPVTASTTATKTVEEEPKEAQSRAQGDEYIKDVVNRAVSIFGLRRLGDVLLKYAKVLDSKLRSSSWLRSLPREEDIDALAFMLSASYGLRGVVGIDQATVLVKYLLNKMSIVYNPFLDTLQCYNPETGLYEPLGPSDDCEKRIEEVVDRILEKIEEVVYVRRRKRNGKRLIEVSSEDVTNLEVSLTFTKKLNNGLRKKGLKRFRALTKRSRYMIALPNRIYLDLGDDFVNKGEVKFIVASPDYYVDIKIDTPIDIELLSKLAKEVPVPEENEDWETYKERYIKFMINAFKEHAPNLYSEFKKWVDTDEYVVMLLEILGYIPYPEYRIRAIFILLGGGNDPAKSGGNGKSTYLELATHMWGKRNVVHIGFQDLVENRFMPSQLYGKLANIVGDMSPRTIKDTSILKALSGGDEITADVKYKNPISFENRAKLIAAMNEMPVFNDLTKALKDRLHVIPFPNTFPENPRYRDKIVNHPEVPKVATLALVALRAVLYRGRFITKGEVDVLSTTVDPVGEFLRQLETTGFNGCRAERTNDANAKTPREELYALFIKWKEAKRVTRPVPKQTFTAQLSRWGIGVTKDSKDRHYYTGIKLICEESKTNEQNSGVGESNDSNKQ